MVGWLVGTGALVTCAGDMVSIGVGWEVGTGAHAEGNKGLWM